MIQLLVSTLTQTHPPRLLSCPVCELCKLRIEVAFQSVTHFNFFFFLLPPGIWCRNHRWPKMQEQHSRRNTNKDFDVVVSRGWPGQARIRIRAETKHGCLAMAEGGEISSIPGEEQERPLDLSHLSLEIFFPCPQGPTHNEYALSEWSFQTLIKPALHGSGTRCTLTHFLRY